MDFNKTVNSFKIRKLNNVSNSIKISTVNDLQNKKKINSVSKSTKLTANLNNKQENFKQYGHFKLSYLKNTKYYPEELLFNKKYENNIMYLRLSNDDSNLALCDDDGKIIFLNTNTFKENEIRLNDNAPITTFRYLNNNDAICCNSNGYIYEIKNKSKISQIFKENNDILCSDTIDNNKLITAGQDCGIRFYDLKASKEYLHIPKGSWYHKGHSNRIFCLKYNDNCLYSGGWDGTIIKWDIRSKEFIHSYEGLINGEMIDIKNDNILIGNQKKKNYLTIYDTRSYEKLSSLCFDKNYYFGYNNIYCCQFSKFDNSIGCGTSGDSFMSLFRFNCLYEENFRITGFNKGIYNINFGYKSKIFAISSGCNSVLISKF